MEIMSKSFRGMKLLKTTGGLEMKISVGEEDQFLDAKVIWAAR